MRVPTSRLTEYCNVNKLMPSTHMLLTWLFRKSKGYGERFTVDLMDFNKWIGKTRSRGIYSKVQMHSIRKQLLSIDLITVHREWNTFVFELSVVDLSAQNKIIHIESKLNEPDEEKKTEKPCLKSDLEKTSVSTRSKQQQQYSKTELRRIYAKVNQIKQIFTMSNLKFLPEVQFKLACQYPVEAIAKSIEYVMGKMNAGNTKINNPEGYVIHALKLGYWQNLCDSESTYTFWEDIVSKLRASVLMLKNKIASSGGLGSSSDQRLQVLYETLQGNNDYGTELLPQWIAEAETNRQAFLDKKQKKLA